MNIFSPEQKIISLGARGEQAAANYLKKCAYKILAVNFSNPSGRRLGEIDIIAQDGEELVFVEVKTRKITVLKNAPLPEESVNRTKLNKLNKAASFYIAKNQLFEKKYRFDVITLLVDVKNNQASLRHLKNVFF